MKTKQVIEQVKREIRHYGMLFFLLVSSFAWMGGCNDEKEKEIPAYMVSTDLQEAPRVPVWVPAHTSPAIRFYFIPEMSIYYDAFLGDYVYWNGIYWAYTPVLPHGYLYFDLFHTNVVFLSVGISHPWYHHHYYVSHYPVYFFIGNEFHHRKHGWRFYNENSGKFHGPHKHKKYQAHYNMKQRKDSWSPGKKGISSPNIKKNDFHSPGIMNPKKNNHLQDNKGGGYKKQPSFKQQPSGGKQTIKGSGNRDGKPEIKGGSKTNKQMDTRIQRKAGPGSKGGGKKGGK